MFVSCPLVADIWAAANKLGGDQWSSYSDFNYDDIAFWLSTYEPPVLYKIAFVWAIWLTWCRYFHETVDPLPPDSLVWYNLILDTALKEFALRLYEAAPMIAWIQVVSNRYITQQDANPIA